MWFKVETSFGQLSNRKVVDFGNHRASIKKGSKLYKSITELSEGAEVKVSGIALKLGWTIGKENEVCRTNWLVKFEKVEEVK